MMIEKSVVLRIEGVSVRKELVSESVSLSGVRYTIRSDRSEPMRLRLAEPLPQAMTTAEVGFHEEHDRTNWRAEDGHRLVYRRTIEPGERVTTGFVVGNDACEIGEFDRPPIVEAIEPAGESIGDGNATSNTDAKAPSPSRAMATTGSTGHRTDGGDFRFPASDDERVHRDRNRGGSSGRGRSQIPRTQDRRATPAPEPSPDEPLQLIEPVPEPV